MSDNEIISSRLFGHPREDVFDAFADPVKLEEWWGPEGFTNTFDVFDFKPGGEWRFTMLAPDGTGYPNVIRFSEISRPERIVFEHTEPVHHFTMEMTFADQDGKCLLTWRMRFVTPGEAEKLADFIADANQQNFDKLERVLTSSLPNP